MEPFPLEARGPATEPQVYILTLEQGERPVVVLDEQLIRRLELTLGQLPPHLGGLVLASASSRSFVAGADLKTIVDRNDADLRTYLKFGARVFAMLSALPCSTAAAIAGAALGGGLELAMHCDGLIGAPSASGRPYPVGLPEAGLCICPGWGGTNLLPARMDSVKAIRMTGAGQTMPYDEAVGEGLFDATVDSSDGLIDAAVAWVRAQPKPTRDGAPLRHVSRTESAPGVSVAVGMLTDETATSLSAAAVMDAVTEGLEKGWVAACESEREHLIRLRHTPDAKKAIEAFFARSKK
jgi:enoyl-CoA hydratase/carnithine racemase